MLAAFFDWLDARTDFRRILSPLRRRILPNGPSWWMTSASCLMWLLVIEVLTGFLLMGTYTPSTSGAWASLHFIERTWAGSLIRGVHYFAAHTMILLFSLHVMRVLISAAFRAPRELIWITGLLMIPLVIGLAMTGNPLSASQKAMVQIEVEGNIIGATPLIGPMLQRLVIGGSEVGQVTLTHLYFLHVAALPVLLTALLVVHLQQVYKHGLTSPVDESLEGECLPYWPHQTIRNMTVLTCVLGGIVACAWQLKAPLEAPADPTVPYSPRPEWYFRCLFELRHYFTGELEFVATHVIPTLGLLVLLALPVIDRKSPRWLSLAIRTTVVVLSITGVGGLTLVSLWRDEQDVDHIATNKQFDAISERIRVIADREPMPPDGPLVLLRNDPTIQGPILFRQHCASCHPHVDAEGEGILADSPSAPNLYAFGTADWIAGLLDPEVMRTGRYFGNTKFVDGDMVGSIRGHFEGVEEADAKTLRQELKLVAMALAAEAGQLSEMDSPSVKDSVKDDVAKGANLLVEKFACTDCHRFKDNGELGSAPDLTGYGSRAWLMAFIGNPSHERFYPEDKNDRMPAFFADPKLPEGNQLTQRQLEMLTSWLRGETERIELEPNTTRPPTRTIADQAR